MDLYNNNNYEFKNVSELKGKVITKINILKDKEIDCCDSIELIK